MQQESEELPEPFEAEELAEDIEAAIESYCHTQGLTFHRTGHAIEVLKSAGEI